MADEADLCFKLPDNVSTMEGALIEPLAVGFHAARQGGAQAGMTAVVTGSGCIGRIHDGMQGHGRFQGLCGCIMEKRLAKAMELVQLARSTARKLIWWKR
ncbi:MAG: hypothetical protein V8S96_07790 [Lachnospiraceae bacterium]